MCVKPTMRKFPQHDVPDEVEALIRTRCSLIATEASPPVEKYKLIVSLFVSGPVFFLASSPFDQPHALTGKHLMGPREAAK